MNEVQTSTVREIPHHATSKDPLPPSSSPTPLSSTPSHPIPTLPIIDISPFLDPTAPRTARLATAQALNAACLSYGFFYLTGHGIPLSTLDTIISLARTFFSLPLAEKLAIKRFDAGGPEGGDSARGYQAVGENVSDGLQDLQEAVDWYAERSCSGEDEEGNGSRDGSVKVLQGRNLWPQRPPEMKGVYEEYVEEVKRVGQAVVHAMGVALGLGPRRCGGHDEGNDDDEEEEEEDEDDDEEDEEMFVRKCKDSFWVMRAINYPPLPKTATQTCSATTITPRFSCGAHTDYGCITLLLSDPTPSALQVQLKDGSWLNADPLRGAFVVNIGDMIERWTNGVWKSTLHRVVHCGNGNGDRGDGGRGQGRISVPFFYEPGFDVEVKALRKFGGGVGARSGGKAEVGTYGEHLLTKVFSNFYYSKRTEW